MGVVVFVVWVVGFTLFVVVLWVRFMVVVDGCRGGGVVVVVG